MFTLPFHCTKPATTNPAEDHAQVKESTCESVSIQAGEIKRWQDWNPSWPPRYRLLSSLSRLGKSRNKLVIFLYRSTPQAPLPVDSCSVSSVSQKLITFSFTLCYRHSQESWRKINQYHWLLRGCHWWSAKVKSLCVYTFLNASLLKYNLNLTMKTK